MDHIITDTHFNHKLMTAAGIRPSDYQEQILNNWLRLVHRYDTIFHLGDVVFSAQGTFHDEVLSKLPGRKVLIRGNHDKQTNSWYLKHGWAQVLEYTTMHDLDHEKTKEQLVFVTARLTHKPVTEPLPPHVNVNIHGHLHAADHRLTEFPPPEYPCILLSLELHGYRPHTLSEILTYKRTADYPRPAI